MKVVDGIFLVGGSSYNLSNGCNVYLIDCGGELVLIDIGSETDVDFVEENIRKEGYNPRDISALLITHSHLDHAGGASKAKKVFGCKLAAHVLTAEAIESGVQKSQGELTPASVEIKLHGKETLTFGETAIKTFNTPGHTKEGGDLCYSINYMQETVLFTGDTAFKCERGLMGGHPISAWLGLRRREEIQTYLRSLQSLLYDVNPDIILPGHGLLVLRKGRDELKECIRLVSEHLREPH